MIDQIGCLLWRKLDKTMMWSIIHVRFMVKTILNYHDQLDWVLTMMETRQDNYVTDCTDAVFVQNETKLSWLIKPIVVCDEN